MTKEKSQKDITTFISNQKKSINDKIKVVQRVTRDQNGREIIVVKK